MKFSTTLTLAATALMSTGTNARIGDGHTDYTSDGGLSKTATNDIGAIAKTDTDDDVAASKTVTDNIGAVAKADTEDYVAALKTTTDNIGAVAKADTEDYVAASKTTTDNIGAGATTDTEDYVAALKTTTDNIGAVAKADTGDYVAASKTTTENIGAVATTDTEAYVAASKMNDISDNPKDDFAPPETAPGGYEVYAYNCYTKTVGALFFLDEDIDMEAMDNNNGEIFVKEGRCKYVGHTKLERPRFDVIGQDVDDKGAGNPWGSRYKCKNMGDAALGDTLCGNHSWPSNACFVDLC